MKTKEKCLCLIGAAGAGIVILNLKPVKRRLHLYEDRLYIKKFIRRDVHDNQHLLSLVDQLSDAQVEKISGWIHSAINARNHIKVQGEKMSDLIQNIVTEMESATAKKG